MPDNGNGQEDVCSPLHPIILNLLFNWMNNREGDDEKKKE